MSTAPPSPLLAAVQPDTSGLRRMKRRATGMLAGTAAVFLATFALPDSALVEFVRAAAEAGTVGGLADWFAVTALFRHPLGVPVPHTALIPRKKDELATRLGEFVTGNFLTGDAVAGELAEARVVQRVAAQLATPGSAHAVSRELAALLRAGLDVLDERRVTAYVLELSRRDLARRSYAPVLGAFLYRAVEGRAQRPLVDVAATQLRVHLETHREQVHDQVRLFLEEQGLLGLLFTTDKRVERLLDVTLATLKDVEGDPEHPIRTWLDGLLESVVDDLRYNPETARSVDARLRALVDDPHLQALVHDLLADVRASVAASLSEGDGDLSARLADLVQGAAQQVTGDAALAGRIEDRLLAAVRWVVDSYGDTAVLLIRRTVAGWEGRDAADRLEASVGRDLQFIRINGTVVGALAGVVLHAVAVLVG